MQILFKNLTYNISVQFTFQFTLMRCDENFNYRRILWTTQQSMVETEALAKNKSSSDCLADSQCLLDFLRAKNNYNLSKKYISFCQHLLTMWLIMAGRTCKWLPKDASCTDLYCCHVHPHSPSITKRPVFSPLGRFCLFFSGDSASDESCVASYWDWNTVWFHRTRGLNIFLIQCWTVNRLTLNSFLCRQSGKVAVVFYCNSTGVL